jgi:predicted nucleic acid-binding protein
MMGLTLDTGALIALERKEHRALALVAATQRTGARITVPTPVVVEWWRGQRGPAANLLHAFHVEPLGEDLARAAGKALAKLKHCPSGTDAVVVASAASRGDRVLTSDVEDLQRLQSVFPAVRLLAV